MKILNIILLVALMAIYTVPLAAQELVDARQLKAKKIADEICDMRSERAASLIHADTAVTPPLFKKVCGAVKKRAMGLAKENKVKIRHAAIKNRNPKHAATEEEGQLHSLFESDNSVDKVWDEVKIEGQVYSRYVRPIFVEPACLACHGEKNKRPKFIQKKYPEDKAFGFKAGDLRGILEVMVPAE